MNPARWRSLDGVQRASIVACLALVSYLLPAHAALASQGGRSDEHWVGTWATAVVARPQEEAQRRQAPAPVNFDNQTLRQIVHVSLGGERIRVVLSNTFGTAPLAIGGAQIARHDRDEAVVPSSNRVLTFGGHPATRIPAGAVVFSDPVALTLPPLADLAIDLYLPDDTAAAASPLTIHSAAHQTNYISTEGNHIGAEALPVETTTLSWFFLSRVEVVAPKPVGAVVVLGDSLTDGSGSTDDTNNRWPDHLARRLRTENVEMGVLNLGIGGNRLLVDGLGVSALARFDRDVLVQTGATHVIVLEGINDIGLARMGPRPAAPPTAAELIAAHRQLIERARAQGLTIYGATMLPFEGTDIPVPNYWTTQGEEARQAVNQWIRTSQAYDAVIDFDAVMRDPDAPTKLLSRYDSGDHLHPSDVGYEAMAEAIDLELLKSAARTEAHGR